MSKVKASFPFYTSKVSFAIDFISKKSPPRVPQTRSLPLLGDTFKLASKGSPFFYVYRG